MPYWMRGWLATAVLAGVFSPITNADTFETRCLSFKPESYVFNSTGTQLQYVRAGTNLTFPGNDETCDRDSQVVSVDLCRVALSIPTSGRSSITFEMWLPDDWSGRFLATGNGGIDGCIKYEDLAYTTQHGFSAVGSNNGHNGTYGNAFYQNPDVVTDFAWRSLHRSTVVGKKLVKQFYQEDHSNSYYLGCSLGGRQGFKSAEMFPDDYDGIVAGAPAIDFSHLIAWRARFFTLTGAEGSDGFILSSIWNTTIHAEVLKQCDGIDGVTDGIIEDPSLCNFDPGKLQCRTNGQSNCLNATQIEIVRKIFSPFVDTNNNLLFPAMQPGSEPLAIQKLYAGAPFSYSDDWYKYVIYDPTWNASTFTVLDALKADEIDPANIRTWPSSLESFQRTGGKIITFHGQQDQQITSYNTPRFYEHLRSGMGYSYEDMDEFLRFFRVSGMFHCNSGPGAWVLGQGGTAVKNIPFKRENNVLAALVDWVENDIAPETLEGTKYVGDDAEGGVAFTRRHCKWPLRNTFLGGDSTNPDNWECQRTEEGYIGV